MKANYIHDFKIWSAEFDQRIPLKVRFSDIDMYGIANNATIISYLEYARIEYFKNIGLMKDWVSPQAKAVPVVADIQCDYVKPIHYDEELSIGVKIEKIGNSSIDIHYLGENAENEVVFTARSTIVQIGKHSGSGFPWTEEEKALFQRTKVDLMLD